MEPKNTITDILKFMNDPDQPLKDGEFKEFWQSLTEEEKAEFKATELPPQ